VIADIEGFIFFYETHDRCWCSSTCACEALYKLVIYYLHELNRTWIGGWLHPSWMDSFFLDVFKTPSNALCYFVTCIRIFF